MRYAAVGVSTLLFDLGILYVAVSVLEIPYYVATPSTFLIAVSGNYVLSRHFVFKDSIRSWHGGYAYFSVAAILGAFVTTTLVVAMVSSFGLYYLMARVLVSGLIGLGNYVFNLYFNFKVVGQHTATTRNPGRNLS
ncbi:MAG TPA: GtrA family protein [Candidatus Paceibacterota bacterium]|nr:GtrA family protein [Candidatus Paceibacterota bacterium]